MLTHGKAHQVSDSTRSRLLSNMMEIPDFGDFSCEYRWIGMWINTAQTCAFAFMLHSLYPSSYLLRNMSGHNKWAQIKRQKGAADAAKSNLWGKLGKRISVESKKANGDVSAANLRSIIDIAKKANMPKDTIERAVAKGIAADAASLESITYETYGPGGSGIVIETLTDSRNRTAAEIKHLLSELGLSLASPGSALWAFEKTAEGWDAKSTVPLSDADNEKLVDILQKIDDHDDVEGVYTNAE